jgi:hypothetical protein
MAQGRPGRQRDLLALMEPKSAVAPAARATVVPLLAVLLLEVVAAETTAPAAGTVTTGGPDEQDRG